MLFMSLRIGEPHPSVPCRHGWTPGPLSSIKTILQLSAKRSQVTRNPSENENAPSCVGGELATAFIDSRFLSYRPGRRTAVKLLAKNYFPVIFVASVLASCQQPYHQPEEHYIFVASNTSVPYWQEAAAGLSDSATQMGVKAELTGPAGFSLSEELTAFQQAVAQKPDGILVSASNADSFEAPINAAIAQGIPVVCVDADVPGSNRVLFVGTDNFRGGQESGKRMAELLVGKGNIAVITIPGQFNLEERMRGVNEALKKYP